MTGWGEWRPGGERQREGGGRMWSCAGEEEVEEIVETLL